MGLLARIEQAKNAPAPKIISKTEGAFLGTPLSELSEKELELKRMDDEIIRKAKLRWILVGVARDDKAKDLTGFSSAGKK